MSRTLRTPRRRTALLALPAAALLALIPSSASAYPNPGRVTGSVVTHDPTMLRTSSGQYLLYATGGGIAAKTSSDRTAFSAGATRPVPSLPDSANSARSATRWPVRE